MAIEINEDFAYFNQYLKLVRRNAADSSLVAHGCGQRYVSMLDSRDEFRLHCWNCDVSITPGSVMMEKVRKAVEKGFNYED